MLLYYLVQMMMACAYQRNQPQTLSHQFSVSISYRYTPVELFRYCTFLIGLVVVELHVEGNEMVGGFLFIVFPLSTSFALSTSWLLVVLSILCTKWWPLCIISLHKHAFLLPAGSSETGSCVLPGSCAVSEISSLIPVVSMVLQWW